MRKILRENGLSVVLGLLFLVFLGGQAVAGLYKYNEEQQEHGQSAIGFSDYLTSSHFLEATMENWESEFLQMAVFVLLTTVLIQKGSPESRRPGLPREVRRVLRR